MNQLLTESKLPFMFEHKRGQNDRRTSRVVTTV